MAKKKRILFVLGSHNQTTLIHKIANNLNEDYECHFTSLYGDGWVKRWTDRGWLEFSIMGKWCIQQNKEYCSRNGMQYVYRGNDEIYDLVITTSDLHIPNNIRKSGFIMVQEGIIEPQDWRFHTAKIFGLSRLLADTSMLGLSNEFKRFFVFSEGYKKEFVRRGVDGSKISAIGVPNFDNVEEYYNNDFPHKDYILVPTSNHRETKRPHDRIGFINKVLEIANGRDIIWKLHPREDHERAVREIEEHAPGTLVYTKGNTEQMVANSSMLIATYSTVVLTAAALNKEIISDYPEEELNALKPIQNGGTSAKIIADYAIEILEGKA